MPTPTYKSWSNMKYRCDNPSCKDYPNYGGRGITYDPAWASYETFRKDMGTRPEGASLDRIDNSKSYSKENCRWSDSLTQNNNRRERLLGVKRGDNTSGTPGVYYDKRRGTWYSRISFKGQAKIVYSGPSKEAAILAREHYAHEENQKRNSK